MKLPITIGIEQEYIAVLKSKSSEEPTYSTKPPNMERRKYKIMPGYRYNWTIGIHHYSSHYFNG